MEETDGRRGEEGIESVSDCTFAMDDDPGFGGRRGALRLTSGDDSSLSRREVDLGLGGGGALSLSRVSEEERGGGVTVN